MQSRHRSQDDESARTSPRPCGSAGVDAAISPPLREGIGTMRRKSWLAGASLVLALGPGAGTALADPSEVRVGGGQLLISEREPVPPDTTEDANDISVTVSGATYTVTDTSGAFATG